MRSQAHRAAEAVGTEGFPDAATGLEVRLSDLSLLLMEEAGPVTEILQEAVANYRRALSEVRAAHSLMTRCRWAVAGGLGGGTLAARRLREKEKHS